MAIGAEYRSKFAALHRQWWRLQMSEKSSSGTKNSKQTNKQTLKFGFQYFSTLIWSEVQWNLFHEGYKFFLFI